MAAFEIHCPRCKVTFPPEAKRCLHCGGKLGSPGLSIAGDSGPQLGAELPFEVEATGEDAPRGSGLRTGFGGMWIIFAVIVTLMRACSGEG